MNHRFRKLVYTFIPMLLLFTTLEGGLYLLNYQGTSIADLNITSGFQQNAYVQRRDRVLGNWFVEKDGKMHSNPYLLSRGFHQQSFEIEPKEKRRFFAIGGSTTYGSPFEHQRKGFPQKIEELLTQTNSEQWEMINVGVAGMDSVSFPNMVKELVQYNPEGILIYAGNNEVRGALTERCSNPYRVGLDRQINQIRTVQLLRDQFRRFRNVTVHYDSLSERQDDCMKREVEFIQKNQDIGTYQKNVAARFYQNIEKAIHIATKQSVSIYLAIPPINLLLPPADQHWNRNLPKTVESSLQRLLNQEEVNWQKVLEIDPNFSLASYHYGMRLYKEGNQKNAISFLENAVSQDHFSKRITPLLQQTIRNLCSQNPTVICVDVNQAFFVDMNGKIPDDKLFEDFCHPTFEKGTTLIASKFIDAIQQ